MSGMVEIFDNGRSSATIPLNSGIANAVEATNNIIKAYGVKNLIAVFTEKELEVL